MSSSTGPLKIMFLTVVRPISCLGSVLKPTTLRAAHPRQRPITYSVLQSTFRLVSTTSKVGSVAAKKKKDSNAEEDDFESAAWENYDAVQETERVDLYNMPKVNTNNKPVKDGEKPRSSRANHYKIHQFMKHYQAAVTKLAKTDRKTLEMLEAIKAPLMEQIKPRSALIDSKVCRTVCSHFGDLADPQMTIALGSPGIGMLSRELVRQGTKNLVLFETNGGIRRHLSDVHKDDKGVRIVDQHLFSNNWAYSETECKLVKLLESSEYKKLKVIHSLTNPMQFPILVTHYNANHMPYHLKDTEIFFFAKPDYATKLVESCSNSSNQLRKFSIWRKFVQTECLTTLDANAFFPPFVTEGLGRGPLKHGSVALIRCTFPAIVFDGRPLTVEERHLYFTFLRHCMVTSTSPVVQTLEKWSPGIGLKLIRQGFPLFIPFTQLTDEQFLGVFMTFLQYVPAGSPIWSLIAGPKYHVKFSESAAPSS